MTKDFPTDSLLNLDAVNNCLRYALNELRALDNPEERKRDEAGDREACAYHLRDLAKHIEKGGMPPDAESIIREATTIPIQR